MSRKAPISALEDLQRLVPSIVKAVNADEALMRRALVNPLLALERAKVQEFEAVLSDYRMPEMNGIELVRRLKQMHVPHPVIMITGHADVPLAIEAMKAGVVDFLEKPFEDDALLDAVRRALELHAESEQQDASRVAAQRRLDTLSTREREVLEGLVAGRANKVIAYDLGISPRTVEVYRANVMTKMEARSLSELVRMTVLAQPR